MKTKPSHLKQSGAALLAFMLVVITGTSYMLVTRFNPALMKAGADERTRVSLNQAKQALIGYAVTYPDIVNPNSGPGYLPCPDKNNDGNAEGSCTFGGTNKTIGRFPYKRLEMEELRDGHGERLWYAISQNFRNNPKLEPLNSETPGDLSVDEVSDVVAVIIAPGSPVNDQNRNPNDNDISTEISNYLEGDNANLDTAFTTNSVGEFNDQLVFITRKELMQAVEKRVLAEVANALRQYQSDYNAFPWLSPFEDPSASKFKTEINTWQGHLPYHWSSDPLSIEMDPVNGLPGINPFSTTIGWTWSNITNADFPPGSPNGTVDASCLTSLECYTGPIQGLTSLNSNSNTDCTWINKDTADCNSASATVINNSYSHTFSEIYSCTGVLTRNYTIDFPAYEDGDDATIIAPSSTTFRTREVEKNTGLFSAKNQVVTITDIYSPSACTFLGIPIGSYSDIFGTTVSGSEQMDFSGDETGTIITRNIMYDIDIDNDELPEWFVNNDWHKLVYVVYPDSEDLPGGVDICSTDPADSTYPCLSLQGAGNPEDNNRGMVIIAGSTLLDDDGNPLPRPSSEITDYFESIDTATPNIFIKDKISTSYNDQIKVLATPP